MKTCNAENCNNPVFGKGFCKRHQWMRDDFKKPNFRYQVKPTKEFGFGFDNQQVLFSALWGEARNEQGWVVCPFTGETLDFFRNSKLYWNCFAHVLPKGKYPYFKLNPDNVKVVFPEFHRIVDQGTYEERAQHPGWKWDLWDAEVERMKAEYEKFKKENLLP